MSTNYASGIYMLSRIPSVFLNYSGVPRVFQFSSSVASVSGHVVKYATETIDCASWKKNFVSYLTVSVVVLIFWWVFIRKIDRAMFVKEWFVQLGERKPILKTKITALNGGMLKGIEKHILQIWPEPAGQTTHEV